MPPAEIDALLEADVPELIRRRLELHGERLQEKVVEQLRQLSRIERLLLEEIDRAPATLEGPEGSGLSAAGTR
jgi:hypothetical protein